MACPAPGWGFIVRLPSLVMSRRARLELMHSAGTIVDRGVEFGCEIRGDLFASMDRSCRPLCFDMCLGGFEFVMVQMGWVERS